MHPLPGRHTWSVTFCNWLTIFRGLQRRETNRSVGWSNGYGARIIRFVL